MRDPVTRVPKIPGSSLAGVYRAYVAMHYEDERQQKSARGQQVRPKPFYPDCAGLGLDVDHGHCRQPGCPVCTVFGFARGARQEDGFAGLAAFSDAHVLLFPVPTRKGPMWVTAPQALQLIGMKEINSVDENATAVYSGEDHSNNPLNLGWLLLPVQKYDQMGNIEEHLQGLGIPDYIQKRLVLVPDGLFAHIVNSNLEVRTSVSIDPTTGAAQEGALFSYEALPRGTVVVWEIIAKNPRHFRVNRRDITAVSSPDDVYEEAKQAHGYFKYLGIGGMATRGMGRIEVLYSDKPEADQGADCTGSDSGQEQPSPAEVASEREEESHE